MNSTTAGDTLEKSICALFDQEIAADRFFAKKNCCRLHRKKGYYSKDRRKNIIFDVSIEIYLPGSTNYSVLTLIECKNYNHPVPVDDIEEFYAKIQQISGGNLKGVVASTNSFQEGALQYARSKGIGLLRYFDKNHFQWLLERSPSGGIRTNNTLNPLEVSQGLLQDGYKSNCFDLYCESNYQFTNSLWVFVRNLISDSGVSEADVARFANRRHQRNTQVEFVGREEIEALCGEVLLTTEYSEGEVPLNDLCVSEHLRTGLRIVREDMPDANTVGNGALGSIRFDPLVIHLYAQTRPHHGRERFTLAHELGHYFLDHGRYMIHEYCRAENLQFEKTINIDSSDVARMEWQSNHFASCLLLPKRKFMISFLMELARLDIRNAGFGALYVDNQICNLRSFNEVTGSLAVKYGVSKSVVRIRLENLSLLTDARIGSNVYAASGAFTDAV